MRGEPGRRTVRPGESSLGELRTKKQGLRSAGRAKKTDEPSPDGREETNMEDRSWEVRGSDPSQVRVRVSEKHEIQRLQSK